MHAVSAVRPIRVVIADAHELLRAGLRSLLDAEEDIVVVGEAADADAAIALVRDARPDVVLIDDAISGRDGIDATRTICADPGLDGVRVLVLGSSETDERLFQALRAGAGGFLTKDSDAARMLEAVRAVAGGGSLLAPRATRRLIDELRGWPERRVGAPAALEELTARERDVVALVAYGLTNDQIARRLVVTPATAKTHVSRAMMKVRARDRAQLVVLAYQSGFVSCRPERLQAA